MNVFNACAKFFLFFFVFLNVAHAEEKLGYEPFSYGIRVFFFLGLIVFLIVMLAWLVNKTKINSNFISKNSKLKVVSSLSLGLKEKLMIVQLGEKQILIGVTSQSINFIKDVDEPILDEPEKTMSFSELLKKAIKK